MAVLIILGTHRVCRQPCLSPSQAPGAAALRLCSQPALLPDVGTWDLSWTAQATQGCDSPPGTQSSHVLLPPQTRPGPKLPALHHSDKCVHVLCAKGWGWITAQAFPGRSTGIEGTSGGECKALRVNSSAHRALNCY